MSEPAKLYCSASRDLAALRQRTREELREVREARKAAESLLLEMQQEGETVARLPGGECFSLRVKRTLRRPTQGPEIFEQLQAAWAEGAVAVRAALREICAMWRAGGGGGGGRRGEERRTAGSGDDRRL